MIRYSRFYSLFLLTILYSSNSLSPSLLQGDYVYQKGDMKVGYKYINKYFSGNNLGSSSISGQEINNHGEFGYSAYGKTMKYETHSLDFAYGITDMITVIANMNFSNKKMSATEFEIAEIPAEPSACESEYFATGICGNNCQLIADPDCDWVCVDSNPNQPTPVVPASNWNMSSNGLEDLEILALIQFFENDYGNIHANLGLTLPTGKIDELDKYYESNTNGWLLPYPMQLGSGTVDPIIGLTGKYNSELFMIGAQLKGVFRVTKNEQDYALGDKIQMNIWGVFSLFPWLGITGRFKIEEVGKTSGSSPRMTVDLTPYGGYFDNTGSSNQILAIGASFILPKGNLDGENIITLEYELPIKQDLNGIQMNMENNMILNWKYEF